MFREGKFTNLPLNSLTPNFVASFVFWGTAFSLNCSTCDSETSKNLAAILKTESRHCYNHPAAIIARENEVLDQSARAIFDNHQCNFTKTEYIQLNPGNSKCQGKLKLLRVTGVSIYRGFEQKDQKHLIKVVLCLYMFYCKISSNVRA